MELPNYFLVDLPAEATLTATMIEEACQTLKRNRERYLSNRTTASLVRLLGNLGENWMDAEYPFRKFALEHGPAATNFSRQTLANGLDGFFSQLTQENLNALLLQDLGHAQRLDEPSATSADQKAARAAILTGPEFLVHITAGVIPNAAFLSIILGVLTRSAQFVKCPTGSTYLTRLFAHSLYDADPKLASCLEVAEWRGGYAPLESILFREADCVTTTGGDETLSKIRSQVPLKTRLLTHGHRVSFAFITQEALSNTSVKKLVARAATDVVAWNQLGCLSPHVIYVENGGAVVPEHFAQMLADELFAREKTEPRGTIPTEVGATISSRRSFYEVRAAHSPDTRLFKSEDSTAWTVIFEADPRFQISCLNRFIYVKPVTDLASAMQGADAVRNSVSTVGLAATEERAPTLVTQLARWGVTRVCLLGQMQSPPLTWRHDGRPSLADLVTWTDWEQ